MKRFTAIILSVFFSGLLIQNAEAQSGPDEKVSLLTDRTLYVTGENIYFSCYIHSLVPVRTELAFQHVNQQASDSQAWRRDPRKAVRGRLVQPLLSTIAYVELITPSGKQVAAKKYKVEENRCGDDLHIPAGIESGIYYLRVYTRYLRNFGAGKYAYQALKIINPFSEEVLNENLSPEGSENEAKLDSINTPNEGIMIIPGKLNTPETVAPNVQSEITYDTGIALDLAKQQYSTREIVTFTLQNEFNIKKLLHSAISVVPVHTAAVTNTTLNSSHDAQHQAVAHTAPKSIYPAQHHFEKETKGLIISGISEKADLTQPGAGQVNMTLINEPINLFYPVKTDSAGRFSFTMPDLYEPHEIYIAPASEAAKTQVKVDNDFCTEKISLPAPLFQLSKAEQETALKLAQNAMIRQQFLPPPEVRSPEPNILLRDTTPFYGNPDQVLYINDYISMPKLGDYFTELPSQVRIRRHSGKTHIEVTGNNPAINVFPPLVMIDFVQVHDIENLLSLNPEEIDRFDIVTSAYIRGTQIYGGIISVISSENDFADAKLPQTGQFLDYQFLETQSTFSRGMSSDPDQIHIPRPLQPERENTGNTGPSLEKSKNPQEAEKNIPDPASTLFWKPVQTAGDFEQTFSFKTSDVRGTFEIIFEGYTTDGSLVVLRKSFTVD